MALKLPTKSKCGRSRLSCSMRQVLPLTGDDPAGVEGVPFVEREARGLPGSVPRYPPPPGRSPRRRSPVRLSGTGARSPKRSGCRPASRRRPVGRRERSSTRRGSAEACGAGQREEVVPVQRAAQAFAVQHRIVAHGGGHAAVGIHVREVNSPPRRSRRKTSRSTAALSGHRLITQFDTITSKLASSRPSSPRRSITLEEAHVAAREAEGLAVVVLVAARDGELLGGHVHADDLAMLADELASAYTSRPNRSRGRARGSPRAGAGSPGRSRSSARAPRVDAPEHRPERRRRRWRRSRPRSLGRRRTAGCGRSSPGRVRAWWPRE